MSFALASVARCIVSSIGISICTSLNSPWTSDSYCLKSTHAMSSLYDSDISDTAKNPMYFCGFSIMCSHKILLNSFTQFIDVMCGKTDWKNSSHQETPPFVQSRLQTADCQVFSHDAHLQFDWTKIPERLVALQLVFHFSLLFEILL